MCFSKRMCFVHDRTQIPLGKKKIYWSSSSQEQKVVAALCSFSATWGQLVVGGGTRGVPASGCTFEVAQPHFTEVSSANRTFWTTQDGWIVMIKYMFTVSLWWSCSCHMYYVDLGLFSFLLLLRSFRRGVRFSSMSMIFALFHFTLSVLVDRYWMWHAPIYVTRRYFILRV